MSGSVGVGWWEVESVVGWVSESVGRLMGAFLLY